MITALGTGNPEPISANCRDGHADPGFTFYLVSRTNSAGDLDGPAVVRPNDSS